MDNIYDVIVVGGGPSGIVAAMTAKSNNPEKSVLLIRKEAQALIPCGVPYIFGSLESSAKDVVPDTGLVGAKVEIKVDSVVAVDTKNKTCATKDGTIFTYSKLVFATGSTPSVPKWLKGAELGNVFIVPKDKEYLDELTKKLSAAKKIVVVGGGFIGVEVSDEIKKTGKEVTLVEILPHCLALAFDEDFSAVAEESLKGRGINIKCGLGVKELRGEPVVKSVLLSDGSEIQTDAVVLSMGYQPNTSLAAQAGLEITAFGFIRVDEYMRTSNPDIFAVGDCAEKRDFATRKPSKVMLASVASAEARVAGMNLFKLSVVKTFSGTISIFATAIGDNAFGSAGLIEQDAKKEGFDIITGVFEGVDKHPGALAGTHKQKVKLVVAKDSGIVLGGEVAGGSTIGELNNLIGFAIQNKATLNSLLTAQIGTHPLLTAPPTAYPLIKAAEAAMKKLKSMK